MKPSSEGAAAAEPVRYREYRAEDFPVLCELDRMCFPPMVAYAPEEIAAALLQTRSACFIAESGSRVVGFLLLGYRRGVGHLITIDLHPDFRRRGIGSRLMELGEEFLRRRGIRRAVLEVAVDNQPAITFYHGRGYVTRRTLQHYYRDGTDAYLMEKAL